MKKNLTKLLEKTGDVATNLATNGALVFGAMEGIEHLDKLDYSASTQALAAGGMALGINYLNKKGIIKGFSKGVNNFARSLKGKAMPFLRNAALGAYLSGSVLGVGNSGLDVYNDFSKDKNKDKTETVEKIVEENAPIVKDRKTLEGRYLRTARFKNILEKEEKEHGIEEGILAGLAMWEGYGNPLQLNNRGDGGAGMIQMQPGIAQHYGLKTYGNSKALGRDIRHGNELKELLEKLNYSYEDAIKYDDRFSVHKNIDAAANFMEDLYEYYDDWDKAISAYNQGQKKIIHVNTTHVKNVRRCQEYYNEKNKKKL